MKVQKTIEGTSKKIENNKTQVLENKPINSVCPVSGEEIDPEITAVYKGKTYALCCKSCLKKFNKDPEKYVSKLSEDGKSLKKIK
ncbi:MAG: YHS domain-containing protein [Ignavibacteriaceae bacterium]|nr:YHS domain-containing protein [Ignavibacteriaceae bacterium]